MSSEKEPEAKIEDRLGKTMFNKIGGQAVIEGVMMRAPGRIATAVRRPDGTIAIRDREFKSVTERFALFRLPVLRGAVALIETLGIGMSALMWSADEAMEEEGDKAEKKSGAKVNLALVGTLVLSLALGIGFFFYLPLVLTDLIGVQGNVMYNLVDGVIRILFLLAYIKAISLWGEMRRVLAYHGAEHKSIFNLEAGSELAVENARVFPRLHPRCGTSFLLIVMVMSVIVFLMLGRPDSIGLKFVRLAFLPLIGGLSYEFLRFSSKWADHPLMKPLIAPGLFLQTMTTNEPDDDQIEVALAALRAALGDSLNRREELLRDAG